MELIINFKNGVTKNYILSSPLILREVLGEEKAIPRFELQEDGDDRPELKNIYLELKDLLNTQEINFVEFDDVKSKLTLTEVKSIQYIQTYRMKNSNFLMFEF